MTPDHEPRGGRAARCGWSRHIPVLLREVLEALQPSDGETYLDATFGAGGYARAILSAADCRVIALDRDPDAVGAGAALVQDFAPRLSLFNARFGDLGTVLAEAGERALDGAVFDLGVSSMQLDDPERGFSFQADGPLDMRMGRDGLSAADAVNAMDETALAHVLATYGEEWRARAIARAIVRARETRPLSRTNDLVAAITRVLGPRRIGGRHPATRTFQALRLYVNDELGELVRGLEAAERALRPGGRLVVVAFHSLEDRIVKRFLALRSGGAARGSRHQPDLQTVGPSFRIVNTRPLTPRKEEEASNPRARSAHLRAATRTEAPPPPLDEAALGLPGAPSRER